MLNFQLYRQKSLSHLPSSMETVKDINRLIGKNLKRLRLEKKLTQERLGELVGVDGNVIARIEGNILGLGKKLMLKICSVLNVKLYQFFLEDDIPIIQDETEKEILYTIREAKPLGVAESISKYGRFIIAETQKKETPGIRKSRKVRHKAG